MKRESRDVTVTYNPNVSMSPGELEEDCVYENAAVCSVVQKPSAPEKRILSIFKPFAPVAVCWVILVIIMALRIHFTGVISAKLSDEMKVSEFLVVQIDTVIKSYSVLVNNIANLSEENQQMVVENQLLKAEIQQMKEENLTLWAEMQQMKEENQTLWAEIQQMKEEHYPSWNQSCYDSYFYGRKKRQTELCQSGWLYFQSRCYLISSRDSSDQKTWQAARDDCREKEADLVVLESPEEQDFIYSSSGPGFGVGGFWIGLRVDGGSWKWIDGSDLTENSRIQPPEDNQHCAVSVKDTRGWRAKSCHGRNEWICRKDALSN